MADFEQGIRDAQAGDEKAFGELVRRFQDMAVGYAARLLGDFHLAEDAAQDAFVEAFRALPQLKDAAAFPAWFRRVVYKQCDRYRRRLSFSESALDQPDAVAANQPDAHANMEAKERRTLIRNAIGGLPGAEREAILLYYFGDRAQNEIARFLEVPLTTLKKRLYTGRQRLKERMLTMVERDLNERRPSRTEDFAVRVTAMIEAVKDGDLEKIEALLDLDERLLRSPGGEWNRPPLHHAAERGHRAVVELLLNRGVDVGDPDEMDKATALHWAAEEGHLDVVRMLVDLGADVNNREDEHQAGPLGWACVLGEVRTEVADYLISKGAEMDVFSAIALGRLDLVRSLIQDDPDVVRRQMSPYEFRRGPLHFAVHKRQIEIAEALLDAGADPNVRDDCTAPPLALLWVTIYAQRERAGKEVEEAFLNLFKRHGFEPEDDFDRKFRRRGDAEPRIGTIVPQFLVGDLERSIAFYTSKLGFTEAFRYHHYYAGIQRDGHAIHLKSGAPSAEERRIRRENEHLDVTCGVQGVVALHDAMARHKVEIIQPLRDMPYGREFYIVDPDGYIIGFVEGW